MRERRRRLRWIPALVAALALLAPGTAGAASLVNGDFESGTLRGWQTYRAIGAGNWFAYKGTAAPIGSKRGAAPVQAPPQGAHAAIADEADPDTLILYQDLALEPGESHRLSLLAYYDTYAPLATPTPNTLSVDFETLGGQKNQQFRIDVMKPTAPLESLEPSDILLNVFKTKPGGPTKMAPTQLTADLSSLAGQTVRLRIAVADNQEVLNAGVDAVALASAAPGQLPPPTRGSGGSGRLSFGGMKANRRKGTVSLTLRVPGPGLLRVTGKGVVPATAHPSAAGSVTLRLKPTARARAALRSKHRLRVTAKVVFTPNGGSPERLNVPVLIKLV